jgi:hypothetical protein
MSMGEASRRLRAHAEILPNSPGCIYCGGANIAIQSNGSPLNSLEPVRHIGLHDSHHGFAGDGVQQATSGFGRSVRTRFISFPPRRRTPTPRNPM